jgi:hypothetical protein
MQAFIHRQNILFFRKQLADAPHETRRLLLLKLLAEEEAKEQHPSSDTVPLNAPSFA